MKRRTFRIALGAVVLVAVVSPLVGLPYLTAGQGPRSTVEVAPTLATSHMSVVPPVITTVATTEALSGVEVFSGDSIQELVDRYPAGTTFVIKAGVHRGQQVVPKDGNTFVGETGAVLSGENVAEFAFGSGGVGVTVRGLVIENYATPVQQGVIRAGGGAQNWVVEGNEIRENGGTGIRAGTGWKVLGNFVHHNGQLGVFGAGGNILVEGNEISYNNTENVDSHWEAGGTKFVHTINLVVRDNYVHHNKGPGLWTDGHNIDTTYENNLVTDNYGPGINHEISHDAVIRNNTVERNGFGWTGWVEGAGIVVNTSLNVEVYGNTVRYNNDGIAGIHTNRDSSNSKYGPWELKNLWVHDNVIVMEVGHTGVVTNTGKSTVFNSWNNRFDRNTYTLGSNDKYYRWEGASRTTQQWRNYGQDPNSNWG